MQGFLASLGVSSGAPEEDVVRINNKRFEAPPRLREWVFRKDRLVYAGKLLGRTRNAWEPSAIQLRELAAEQCSKAWVKPEAAWLFVCGRDVFAENVDHAEPALVEEQNYLIMLGEEALGIARAKRDKDRLILKNQFDLGDFLRRERK